MSQAHLEFWYFHDWLIALPLFATAALFAALELPSLGNRGHGHRAFVTWFLAPIVLGETVVSVHRYWTWRFEGAFSLRSVVLISVVGMAVPWVVGGFGRPPLAPVDGWPPRRPEPRAARRSGARTTR